MNRHRVASPAVVEQMAAANHIACRHTSHFASVELAGVVYFWAA